MVELDPPLPPLKRGEIRTRDFIKEARDCVGTPYRRGQARKGLGMDCVGLLIHLAREFDIPFRTEPYVQTPVGDSLLRELELYLNPVGLTEISDGDILCFWIRSPLTPTHVGIFDSQMLIHASELAGKVVRVSFEQKWRDRIAGIYRVRGMNGRLWN